MTADATSLFKRFLAQTSDFEPFIIDVESAQGIYIYDKNGKKYLDFTSGMCANNLGNRHPEVMKALYHQSEKYLHTMVYGEFVQTPQVDFAQSLCQQLPPELQMVFFVNSGGEAIEGALKLARLINHRSGLISFKKSYHGSSYGALSLVGQQDFKDAFQPILPHTLLLNYNETEGLEQITEETCCVIAEVIQSGAGMNPAQPIFLEKLRQRCTQTGALLIFDEIQTGFGRTGELFAFQHYGVVPDILCIAKSMGGGLPIGAFVSSPEKMEKLNNGHPLLGHATTFGGHPLSCATGLAALSILSQKKFLQEVALKEQWIRHYFQHPLIHKIHGKGLFLAAELKENVSPEKVVAHCVRKGLLLLWLLFNHQALALTPALIISEEEIQRAATICKEALDEIA